MTKAQHQGLQGPKKTFKSKNLPFAWPLDQALCCQTHRTRLNCWKIFVKLDSHFKLFSQQWTLLKKLLLLLEIVSIPISIKFNVYNVPAFSHFIHQWYPSTKKVQSSGGSYFIMFWWVAFCSNLEKGNIFNNSNKIFNLLLEWLGWEGIIFLFDITEITIIIVLVLIEIIILSTSWYFCNHFSSFSTWGFHQFPMCGLESCLNCSPVTFTITSWWWCWLWWWWWWWWWWCWLWWWFRWWWLWWL